MFTSRIPIGIFPIYLIQLLLVPAPPSLQSPLASTEQPLDSLVAPQNPQGQNAGSSAARLIPFGTFSGSSLNTRTPFLPTENKLVPRAIIPTLDAKCRARNPHLPSATKEEQQFVEFAVIWGELVNIGHFTRVEDTERIQISGAHNRLEDTMTAGQRQKHIEYYSDLMDCAKLFPKQGIQLSSGHRDFELTVV